MNAGAWVALAGCGIVAFAVSILVHGNAARDHLKAVAAALKEPEPRGPDDDPEFLATLGGRDG